MNVENSSENGVIKAIGDGENQAPHDAPVPESFQIDSATTANWLVRKILEFRRYQEQVRAWAGAEIHKAEQEESRLLEGIRRCVANLTENLWGLDHSIEPRRKWAPLSGEPN